MDEDAEPGSGSVGEYQLFLNAVQEEEQEFRNSEAEVDARAADQIATLTRDMK